ncbi:MAG: MBL fold metallo-hydrolase [Calditrichaceae bacterium]
MTTLKFWGVRGSIPTPGPDTVRYGGNTACIELRHGNKLVILDGGSGLRALGNELIKSNSSINANIFISHMHWDHIQGIPFFTPAYIPGNHFVLYGAEDSDKSLADIISGQMDPTYFPIELSEMGAKLEFQRLYEGNYTIDGIKIQTIYVNHPGNALGYKFTFGPNKIVYISDNEPLPEFSHNESTDQDADSFIADDGKDKLIKFIKNASILIHDAQYTPDEYSKHMTWGHSPYDYTVKLAIEAGVKKLILFHHDPLHNDDFIDDMLMNAKKLASELKADIEISAAREGMTVSC